MGRWFKQGMAAFAALWVALIAGTASSGTNGPLAPRVEWQRGYNAGELVYDHFEKVATSADGDAWVCGWSTHGGEPPSERFTLLRYDAAGNRKWASQFTPPPGQFARAVDLVVDGAGNAYVTGELFAGGGTLILTVKFGADGAVLWNDVRGPTQQDQPRRIAFAPGGNVAVMGENPDSQVVLTYSPAGVLLNAVPLPYATREFFSVGLDATGKIYQAGVRNSKDFVIQQYSPGGSLLHATTYSLPTSVTPSFRDAHVDANGSVWITAVGLAGGGKFGWVTARFASDGTLLWDRRLPDRDLAGPHLITEGPKDLTVDDAGNCVVTGMAQAVPRAFNIPINFDCSTVKYSPEGEELWVRHHTGATLTLDQGNAAVMDAAGNVYVTGVEYDKEPRFVVLAYSPEGALRWMDRFDDPIDQYNYKIWPAVAPDGTLYVGAENLVPVTRRGRQGDFLLRRYGTPVASGGVAAVAPARSINFGTVKIGAGKAAVRKVTVTNKSTTEQLVVTVGLAQAPFYGGSTYTLAPKEKLQVELRFIPGAAGKFQQNLTLRTSAPNLAQATLALTGTGR